jgi:hypothetical protein
MRGALNAVFSLLLLGMAPSALAQVPIPLTVSGNQATGEIALPGGIAADLTIEFESVTGLTPTALDASAILVDPLDPTLLVRLPASCSVPEAFPVLVHIGPSASSTLTFHGVVEVSLHTYNLELDPAIPFALDKAPDAGAFQDIATQEGRGSYRVGGDGGGLSEFIIVIDGRPIDTVITEKFDALQATLTDNASSMPPFIVSVLQTLISQARTLYDAGLVLPAINKLTLLTNFVVAHSGGAIPDVWIANDPGTINVAGLLRSGAGTLKFSLDRKLAGQP